MRAKPKTANHSRFWRTPIWFVVSLFFLANYTPISAQTYYFDTYGPEDGLSSKIYCLLQDKYHNLWMGTPNGVTRFDGNNFQEFNKKNGLASSGVKCMMMDSQENIWLGHLGGGISYYDNTKFKKYTLLEDTIKGDITSIFEDDKKRIWITTYNSGAFVISNPTNEKTREYKHFIGKDGLSDIVFDQCHGTNGIFLVTDVGVRKFNEPESKFEIFYPKGFSAFFSIITMYEDGDQDLWFGTHNGGLYRYDHTEDTVYIYDKRNGLPSNNIFALTQDVKGDLWIGCQENGACRFDGENFKTFNQYNGLNANQINDIIEDVEGNILFASHSKGLSIYKGDLIENYGIKEGLKDLEVYAIIQDYDGDYWVGTDSGISVLPGRNSKGLSHNLSDVSKFRDIPEASKDLNVRFLKMDGNHNIWIGTEDNRVLLCDSLSLDIINAFPINRLFPRGFPTVTAMDIDQDNYLWIGTGDGLIYYNVITGETARLSDVNGLIGNEITAIHCDKLNQVWVGAYSKQGISKITNKTNIINYLGMDVFTPACFAMDTQGKLWIGTRGQGIYMLENNDIVPKPNITDGLLSSIIRTLNIDDSNRVYIGSSKGLNVYDQKNQLIKTYNKKNGFLGIETNPSASFYSKQDKSIWFGTNQGINRYDITESKSTPSIPLVYITELKVNQQHEDIVPDLKLRSFENQITIDFKSICLTNADAVQYKVVLEGLGKTIEETTSQTSITYQSLPPHKYTFRVMARNSDGIWSSHPAVLEFTITKPFYKRWYVIVSAIVIVVLTFWFYVKYREQQLVKEKRVLAEKVRERTAQLEDANMELEDKNKDITDSIRYALRIQLSILPPEIPFKDTFVLFKPKDIVSGDFYYMTKVGDKEIIAAVDCTGHGVPGAFMSFVGYSAFNEVVKEKNITQPAAILNALNETVVAALNLQGDEAIKDGMDLALIAFNTKTKTLEYAGAYNPLYLVRDGELLETKGDRLAIGKSFKAYKEFTNHSMKIQKGDTIYLFSDGYADQFGGEDEKKFKPANVRKLLLEIQDKDMPTQKRLLNETIENWRGEVEQLDDILFIGRKF